MSLLLDALKKAEKAKDDAKRRSQGADSAAGEDETVIHVRTRSELPDISRPLEIHSEDIPGRTQPGGSDNPAPNAFFTAPASGLALESPSPADSPRGQSDSSDQPARRRQPATRADEATDTQATQRAAARNVFEAKFKEPNPKLPFYITMTVLGMFALGTVVYFWYQLRPPPALVNTDAKPRADEKKIDVPDSQLQNSGKPVPQGDGQPVAIPGLQGEQGRVAATSATPATAPSTNQAAPTATATAKPAAAQEPAVQTPTRRPGASARQETTPQARRNAAPDPSKLSVTRAAPAVNPKVDAGWLAYNQGDLQAARSNYQDVLREEATNRDALLGMAALEVRANRFELAEAYYQKLIDANPRDSHAQAGLLALRTQLTDPVEAESRAKSLLANDPDAHVLYFTLGNQYAQQGRWPEAQKAYFKAFSADPENPDFAYNLAVSLDQVKQPKLALEYYRRAIALAQQRSGSFDQAIARNRAQELAR